MNSFGLGLVLNFVDNASAGMNSASAVFNNMSAMADSLTSSVSASATEMASIAYSLSAVGSVISSVGQSIVGVFTGITEQVISTGGQMQGFRMQLNALYKDEAESKLQEIKDYAAKSVFEVESLMSAVTIMKAVGIEAMDEVTTSSGNYTQRLMDYASDIAGMIPNMHNVYGTGVNAAMGAMKEYIAEGNAMSLKRGAGLDITGILGEDKGKTIEERTRQIADLVEVLGIAGYTKNLEGTPTQLLAKLQDTLYNLKADISDMGVFDSYARLLSKLAFWVEDLTEDTELYNSVVSVLGDTISTILSPLESMLDWLIENSNAILMWIKEHPTLTKNILLTVAAIGAFLVVGGSALKMLSSIAFAMSGFKMLKSLPSMLALVGNAFKTLIAKAFPFVALAGLAYYAWKNNLFGIKDAFKELGTIMSLISDAWADNTLSEENYNLANSLGILPLIEALLMLKYYWDFFVDGFKTGFKSFFDSLAESLSWMQMFGIDVKGIASAIGELMRGLTDTGAEDKWEKIGEIAGNIAASFIALAVIVNVLKPIISVLSFIGKTGSFIFKIFKSVGGVLKTVFQPLLNVIRVLKGGQGVGFFTKLLEVIKAVASGGIGLKDAMTVVFGSVATVIMGVVSLITGIVTAVVGFVKQLTEGFSWFWEIIKWIGIALGVVGAILLGVAAWPAVIVGAIIGVLTLLIVLIKDNWNAICNFFSKMGSWIYDNVIKPIADFFVGLWNGIVNGVTTVVNAVKNFVVGIASWVYNKIISPIVNFFTTYIFPIIAKIVEIIAKVVEIVVVLVVNIIKQLGIVIGRAASWVYNNLIKPIADFFVGLWNGIVSGITSFIASAKTIIMTIVGWINTRIITPLANTFSALWEGIKAGISSFIEGAKEIFITIVSWISEYIITPISDFFATLWEGITIAFTTVVDGITSGIKAAFNGVLSFVVGLINGVIWAINGAIGLINAIPGVNITKIQELELPKLAEGGVVNKPTTAIIGEAGAEAIVPIENNTGWINNIASLLMSSLLSIAKGVGSSNVSSVNTSNNTPKIGTQFITSNNYNSIQSGSSPTGETLIDNSVTFSEGSIVIQLANASEAELEKVAEKLMKIIARKQQLKNMAVRA